MTISIVDYGMGNIGSVTRAISACGYKATIASTAEDILQADKIILPGVGSYTKAMQELRARGLEEAILESAIEDEIPVLGICLGMQILSTLGHEHGETKGLGLIPGEVVRLRPQDVTARVPHVGWNSVEVLTTSPLFYGIPSGSDFYFVHSYHYQVESLSNVLAKTEHGGEFTCAVQKDNVFGMQFHPEKSQKLGLKLIQNFLEL
ncbi:imidazole glycerol phosphate synthase, glutamine amidotransferase subunit with HisF [Vibrio coralliirubri]|uniref:imidazole glycerol phosphate synthase subunit HisH n=1 Tax=Vibrio coralliirubri TaxID=1516159 RepID=UPI000631B6B3|nr:imidazole glycerol phosphate synthase subunit HisH [Vibrio coralliirubri]MCY9864499.1 imidazole glycerol phosphate synthase subunit HisH [Vibrio coralliirubri]CDT77693.1 imidazole glycerol phosphate synthase, glutamine amidotransferase subunit with HisF [Vibrio coralliirubri]